MELTLAEQLLLLSYDDVTGKPAIPADNLDYGLSGAHLLDLNYAGALVVDHGKLVAGPAPSTDPAVSKIKAHKPHTADYWVYHLATPELRERLLDDLVSRGILDRREHRVLGIFASRAAYPEVDPAQERALVDHLRDVATGQAQPDQRSVSLLALAHSCGLDRHLFPDLDQTALRHQIGALTQGEWCGPAVSKAITALNAAVLAAVSGGVAPAVATVPAT